MNILCLQETNAADTDVQDRLDIQLQAMTSIWTQYCGVITVVSIQKFNLMMPTYPPMAD